MSFCGKTILGNYYGMANEQSQTGGHHSQIDEIKFAKGARGYSGTLNGYREEGDQKICHKVRTYTY